jgi:hypothetical protein
MSELAKCRALVAVLLNERREMQNEINLLRRYVEASSVECQVQIVTCDICKTKDVYDNSCDTIDVHKCFCGVGWICAKCYVESMTRRACRTCSECKTWVCLKCPIYKSVPPFRDGALICPKCYSDYSYEESASESE